MAVVRIRLVADTAAELDRALADVEACFGPRAQLARPRRPGRRGDWLAYGTLRTSDSTPEGGEGGEPDDAGDEHGHAG